MKRYVGGKFIVLLFAILLSFSSCALTPKNSFRYPEITYGEFPFRLEYKTKISDEIIIIEDTIICEFKGHELRPLPEWFNLGTGIRIYEERLMSEKEEFSFILYSTDEYSVKYNLGSGGYYLGDSGVWSKHISYDELVLYEYQATGEVSEREIQLKDLEDYGIYIIKFDRAEPIENTFKRIDN